jgi:hypothetical protein
MLRSSACDGPTGTSSRWRLTSEGVLLSQLRRVEAKEAAQPAMVRHHPLRDICDRFAPNAGMRNREIPLCCGFPLLMQGA